MEEIKNEGQATPTQNVENAPQQVAKVQPKRSKMTFGKVFLAALLAVVAGSVVTFVFWISLFSGFSALIETPAKPIPQSAILKIDFNESLIRKKG